MKASSKLSKTNSSYVSEVFTIIKVENGVPIFSKEELKATPEFSELITRRKTSKGDSDGRKKVMNNRELLYVKYMADYDTHHKAFSGKERHERAKHDSGLPNNWKPDEVIEIAINKYKEILLVYSPSIRLLNALEQGMMLSAEAVEGQIKQVRVTMDVATRLSSKLENVSDIEEAQQLMESLMNTSDSVQAKVKSFMKMVSEFPKMLEQVRALRKQVLHEQSGNRQKRGGHNKGNREDPN